MNRKEKYLVSFLILTQRAELQKKFTSFFLYKLNGKLGNILNFFWILIQSFNSTSILKKYESSLGILDQELTIYQLFDKLRFTSDTFFSIADIGCGIGGYHKNWLGKFPNSTIYLIDQSKFQITALLYGHGKENRHYNNLNLAKKYLLLNANISENQIKLVEKTSLNQQDNDFMIVVSFYSLGFHYPLETYWEFIWSSGKVKFLIVDIRLNSESEKFLGQKLVEGFFMSPIAFHVRSTRYLISPTEPSFVHDF